ncbi:MAG: hypothetical protein NC238_02965 [Dehalobacter sp.]|nr:hypothetical protein [Dehalobacter sp.]
MFSYNVCNQTDKELFDKCLDKLKNIEGMEIEEGILEDVDGSLVAKFRYKDKQVLLQNDEDVGALYIKSETDLEKVLFN